MNLQCRRESPFWAVPVGGPWITSLMSR